MVWKMFSWIIAIKYWVQSSLDSPYFANPLLSLVNDKLKETIEKSTGTTTKTGLGQFYPILIQINGILLNRLRKSFSKIWINYPTYLSYLMKVI